MKEYRIGEFSREMGVTSAFLKYYEKCGIIKPKVKPDSNYRYYDFTQSKAVINCKRLKNYGFNAKEIKEQIGSSEISFNIEKLDDKVTELTKQKLWLDSVIEETNKIVKNFHDIESGSQWYISNRPDIYFLPHTNGVNYHQDESIRQQVPQWMEWMPLAKSAKIISLEGQNWRESDCQQSYTWGFSIKADYVDKYHLPIKYPARKIPGGRSLVVYEKESIYQNWATQRPLYCKDELILNIVKENHFKPSGDILKEALLETDDGEYWHRFMVSYILLSS